MIVGSRPLPDNDLVEYERNIAFSWRTLISNVQISYKVEREQRSLLLGLETIPVSSSAL